MKYGDEISTQDENASRIRSTSDIQKTEILTGLQKEIQGLLHDTDYFALVYGSCAYKENPFRSDVDLVIVVDDKFFSEELRWKLVKAVADIHRKFSLPIDDEIPYENKILISYSEAEQAILGAGLKIKQGRIVVPKIVKKKSFLTSKSMRLRLFHNAVTTSSFVLCGDARKFNYFRERGLQTLAWILIHQLPHGGFRFSDLVKVLYSNGDADGEHYLGYKKIPFVSQELEGALRKIFYKLAREGALFELQGGYQLSQEYDRTLLNQLAALVKSTTGAKHA